MPEKNFGWALDALKAGKRVARSGWNGKDMWLLMIPSGAWNIGPDFLQRMSELASQDLTQLPWIGMKTAGDEFVPWLASQTDLLADDWGVVE